jgi:hypothetical protein
VRAAEAGAREFGVLDLYLYTERAETLYARLGWEMLEQAHFLGQPVAIMRRSLRS